MISLFGDVQMAVTVHRVLLRIVLAMAQLLSVTFLIVYLGYSLSALAAAYALMYLFLVIAGPFFAEVLYVIGNRAALLLAGFALLGSLASLFAAATYLGYLAPAVGWFFVFSGLFRALYRIPYEHGTGTTALHTLVSDMGDVLVALSPLLAGITAALYDVPVLVNALVVLTTLSMLPILALPKTHIAKPVSFFTAWAQFVSVQNRKLLSHDALRGAEGVMLFVFWPAVAISVVGSFLLLGTLMTVSLLLTLVIAMALERARPHVPTETFEYAGNLIAASSWITRILVYTPIDVAVVNIFHGARSLHGRALTGAVDPRADNDLWIDGTTMIRDMGEHVGRGFMCLGIAVLAFLFGNGIAFVVACIALAWFLLARALVR